MASSKSAGIFPAVAVPGRLDAKRKNVFQRFDADPWLMGVPNGVLDLHTGRLVDAKPRQRITKQAGAIFDPDAKAPLFESFLETALPDAKVRAFAQRAVGYSLIGVPDEEVFCFAHGRAGPASPRLRM